MRRAEVEKLGKRSKIYDSGLSVFFLAKSSSMEDRLNEVYTGIDEQKGGYC